MRGCCGSCATRSYLLVDLGLPSARKDALPLGSILREYVVRFTGNIGRKPCKLINQCDLTDHRDCVSCGRYPASLLPIDHSVYSAAT